MAILFKMQVLTRNVTYVLCVWDAFIITLDRWHSDEITFDLITDKCAQFKIKQYEVASGGSPFFIYAIKLTVYCTSGLAFHSHRTLHYQFVRNIYFESWKVRHRNLFFKYVKAMSYNYALDFSARLKCWNIDKIW